MSEFSEVEIKRSKRIKKCLRNIKKLCKQQLELKNET